MKDAVTKIKPDIPFQLFALLVDREVDGLDAVVDGRAVIDPVAPC